MSRLYHLGHAFGPGPSKDEKGFQVELLCYDNGSPLDVCRMASDFANSRGGAGVHAALVHFTAVGGQEPNGPFDRPDLARYREQELNLRTNYHLGCLEMRRQLHADPQTCVDSG